MSNHLLCFAKICPPRNSSMHSLHPHLSVVQPDRPKTAMITNAHLHLRHPGTSLAKARLMSQDLHSKPRRPKQPIPWNGMITVLDSDRYTGKRRRSSASLLFYPAASHERHRPFVELPAKSVSRRSIPKAVSLKTLLPCTKFCRYFAPLTRWPGGFFGISCRRQMLC